MNELAVVDHIKIAAELLVLVLENVVTMGASGQQNLELPLLEEFHLLLCGLLEKHLLPHDASGIAAALFIPAKHTEIDAALLH